MDLQELRQEYEKKFGKKPFGGWKEKDLLEKLNEKDFTKYKELPPPIVEALELEFGAWLKEFEIGKEYREDFGGDGMYIKVPKKYSTEYKETSTPVYDNQTKSMIGTKTVVIEDIRWKPLKDLTDVKKWIGRVKSNIIDKAYQRGIRLPSTNTPLEETNQTREEYERSLHQAAPQGQPAN